MARKIKKEVLETIEDDVQLRLDKFFDSLTSYFNKEARLLKEESLRTVCVDNPHIEAKVIQEMYDRLAKECLSKENMKYYLDLWAKTLTH